MFNGCISLISVDLPKWNFDKTSNIHLILNGCNSLKSLPDIFNMNNSKTKSIYQFLERISNIINNKNLCININETKILTTKKENKVENINFHLNESNDKIIKGIIDISTDEINTNIVIFNTDINDGIDVYK